MMDFILDFGPIIAAFIPLLAGLLIKSDGKSNGRSNFNINAIIVQQNVYKDYHESSKFKNINNTQDVSNVFPKSLIDMAMGFIVLLALSTLIAIKYSAALNIATVLASIIFAGTYFIICFKIGNEKFSKILFVTVLSNVILSYFIIYFNSLPLEIPDNLVELYSEIGFCDFWQDYTAIANHTITSFATRVLALIWLLLGTFELVFKKARNGCSYPCIWLLFPFLSLFLLWAILAVCGGRV